MSLRLPRVPRSLAWLLAILPVSFPLVLIARYGVDVPFADQWLTARLFIRLADGSLSVSHLFELQNEFRQFFPHLLFLALGVATRWNVHYEMLVSVLLACLVSLNIYRISHATIQRSATRLWLLIAANLLIFSPIQYENWLHGIQIVYFMPIACLTGCLTVAYSHVGPATKFLVAAVLSAIATFSAANGVLCWVLALPVLLVVGGWRRSVRRLFVVGWTVLGLFSLGLYLYGYRQPPRHPSLTGSLSHPGRAFQYLAAFLGAPLAPEYEDWTLTAAIVLGTLSVILFGGACLYLWIFRRDRALVVRGIGFVAIGAYALGTALMVTPARLGFGIWQALADRYATFSLYLMVSLVYLVTIVVDHARGSALLGWVKTVKLTVPVVAIFILLNGLMAAQGMVRAGVWRARILYGKAGVLLINVVRTPELLPFVFIDLSIDRVAERANGLNDLGYLRPRLVASEAVEQLFASTPLTPPPGAFEELVRTEDGRFTASGWAVLPDRREPAHAVLLTSRNGAHRILAIVPTDAIVPVSLLHTLRRRPYAKTLWRHTFAPGDLAVTAVALEAWAFDAESGRAFKLAGTHSVPPRQ